MRRPALWGVLTWLASAAAGGTALVLADFGAPAWVFAALLLWLATAGLPTTIGALLVVSAWGRVPGLKAPSLAAAVAAMAVCSLVLQLAAALAAARLLRRWRRRRA